MSVYLSEIMESIQGEGLYIGTRHIFVRFTGCNLKCTYCDTQASCTVVEDCEVSQETGKKEVPTIIKNPVSLDQILYYISNYSSKWISLTGGEPLLSADFISILTPILKQNNYKILLETNGTLHNELEKCISYIDVISMDMKLPSSTNRDCFTDHRLFLKKTKDTPMYVKIVLSKDNNLEEIDEAINIVKQYNRFTPVILQPATSNKQISDVDLYFLIKLQERYLKQLEDVRIIPQLHPLLNII